MTEIEELRSAKDSRMPVPVEMGGKGKIWVTRKGIRVDRIGSAWLIRRFVHPQASFRFVTKNDWFTKSARPAIDMFEGEFTHTGDRCTFEALVRANDLGADAALAALAEIVHNIDLKDERYQRPETLGLARLINGMCLTVPADAERLERGAIILIPSITAWQKRRSPEVRKLFHRRPYDLFRKNSGNVQWRRREKERT
jgi:hypothetical protein